MKKLLILIIITFLCFSGFFLYKKYGTKKVEEKTVEETVIPTQNNEITLNEEEAASFIQLLIGSYIHMSDLKVSFETDTIQCEANLEIDDQLKEMIGVELPFTGSVDCGFTIEAKTVDGKISTLIQKGNISIIPIPSNVISELSEKLQNSIDEFDLEEIRVDDNLLYLRGNDVQIIKNG